MFRTLCRIADEGFYQVSRMVRPGVREREMADCFRQSVIATGFCVPSSWSMFSTGPSGARLTLPEDGIIESTHVVKYDAGVNAEFDFYTTDTSRAWVMKDAAPELFRLKDRLYEGQRRMIAAARPGLPVCELFRTAWVPPRQRSRISMLPQNGFWNQAWSWLWRYPVIYGESMDLILRIWC